MVAQQEAMPAASCPPENLPTHDAVLDLESASAAAGGQRAAELRLAMPNDAEETVSQAGPSPSFIARQLIQVRSALGLAESKGAGAGLEATSSNPAFDPWGADDESECCRLCACAEADEEGESALHALGILPVRGKLQRSASLTKPVAIRKSFSSLRRSRPSQVTASELARWDSTPGVLEGRGGEERESELIELGCKCRGELALVHYSCALHWFSSREAGNVCEVCGEEAAAVRKGDLRLIGDAFEEYRKAAAIAGPEALEAVLASTANLHSGLGEATATTVSSVDIGQGSEASSMEEGRAGAGAALQVTPGEGTAALLKHFEGEEGHQLKKRLRAVVWFDPQKRKLNLGSQSRHWPQRLGVPGAVERQLSWKEILLREVLFVVVLTAMGTVILGRLPLVGGDASVLSFVVGACISFLASLCARVIILPRIQSGPIKVWFSLLLFIAWLIVVLAVWQAPTMETDKHINRHAFVAQDQP